MVDLASILPEEWKYPLPKLPYRDVWEHYADAGLRPVPVADKPPAGFQKWTRSQAERWATGGEHWAYAQTAITLPDGLVILDDDDAEQIAPLETELGPRPATMYSTSRGSGALRRKSLYRVPEGSRLGGGYPGGDVIDSRHRFAFVCPTVSRKTGEVEQWYAPDDSALERFPTADDVRTMVADLPAAWVEYLSRTAPRSAAVRPYDGPTTFEGGKLSPRVLEVAERHPDTTRYPDANGALMALAWTAVRFPEAAGIETLRDQIMAAYVNRADTRTPTAERQTRMDRAWASALATQAAQHQDEWAEMEAEVGEGFVKWWRSHTPTDPVQPATSSELARLEALTPVQAEAEFGWDWRNRKAQAELRAMGTGQHTQQTAKAAPDAIPESWKPREITKYLDPDYEPPKPDVLTRSDGLGLFYRGVVNEIHGAAGTGKTFVSEAAACEVLRAGERVLYLNYEEADSRIVTRLRMLGATPEQIERFDIVRPEVAPTPAALEELKSQGYGLVVIDTVGESIPNVGTGDSNSTDDVTVWHKFARTFADAGACVLTVDHITKAAAEEGGSRALMPIGSQAKYAGYKGAVFLLEPHLSGGLTKGERGALKLILAKDNDGGLGLAKGDLAGTFWLDSTDPANVSWEVLAPLSRDEQQSQQSERESLDDLGRETAILNALRDAGQPISASALRRALGYSGNSMSKHGKPLQRLIARKAVVLSEAPRGSRSTSLLGLPTPSAPAALSGMPEGAERAVSPSASNPAIPSAGRSPEGAEGQGARSATPSAGHDAGGLETRKVNPAIPAYPRSPLAGITDEELDALLGEDDSPEPPTHPAFPEPPEWLNAR